MSRSRWLPLAAALLLLALLVLNAPSLRASFQLNRASIRVQQATTSAETMPASVFADLQALSDSETGAARAAQRTLGYAQLAQGDADSAVATWSPIAAEISDEMFDWALNSRRADDRMQALEWYELATQLTPDLADGWYFAGRMLEVEGQPTAAQSHYLTALEQETAERVGRSDIAFRLAALAWANEDGDSAEMWAAQALADDRFQEWQPFQVYYLQGEMARLNEQPARAAAAYREVIARQPEHYWAHVHLGGLVWTLEQQFEEAQTLLRRAAEIDPTRKWAFRALGDVYREAGNSAEAIEMYRQALAIDPNDSLAQTYLTELETNE